MKAEYISYVLDTKDKLTVKNEMGDNQWQRSEYFFDF